MTFLALSDLLFTFPDLSKSFSKYNIITTDRIDGQRAQVVNWMFSFNYLQFNCTHLKQLLNASFFFFFLNVVILQSKRVMFATDKFSHRWSRPVNHKVTLKCEGGI